MTDDTRKKLLGVNRLLPLSLGVCGLFLPLAPAAAQSPQQEPAAIEETDTGSAANQELLLFWEEKELYVQSATRVEKPLSQTAENVSVITAKEIEDMNAHTVAEVLKRVPGMFVDTYVNDFGSASSISIQGSEDRHVLVLLDGVAWNFLSGGNAETSSVPIRIIDRIEIVKGPASSAWGSALGGVINIITKGTGDTTLPKGMASVSYGERNTQDYGAELSGKGGPVGYYLQAGRQKSAGLRNNRTFDNNTLYAKLNAAPTRDLDLTVTAGYSDPEQSMGEIPSFGISGRTKISSLHATGAFDYRLAPGWAVKGSTYFLRQRLDSRNNFLGSNDLFKGLVDEERTVGGSLRLTYSGSGQNAVVGADASRGVMDQTNLAGPLYQSFGVPASAAVSPSITKWALFANDTISYGSLSVTPGVRLDHNNVSGYFFSPSLGLAYELGERTVARASVARGFTSPPLGFTSGGGIFVLLNRALSAEKVWSYQAGLETGLADYLHLKGNLFRHDMTNEMTVELVPGNAPNRTVNNRGNVTRQGFEIEAETAPFHNVSLKGAHTYVNVDRHSDPEAIVNYSYLMAIKYDDRQSLMGQLAGTYTWWDKPAANDARYNTFVWDLNLSKRFQTVGTTSTELFLAVHNLFSSNYCTVAAYPNPGRWFEGGVRVRF